MLYEGEWLEIETYDFYKQLGGTEYMNHSLELEMLSSLK